MAFSPASPLLSLPTELQLITVHFILSDNDGSKRVSGTRSLLPLSLACRHLRQLCLAPLFSRLKITHTDRLRVFGAQCAEDVAFASAVKQLDLSHVKSPEERESWDKWMKDRSKQRYLYGPDLLPTLLPLLKSLERLDVAANQIDANLLAVIDSHPKLLTVAVNDPELSFLRLLASSTPLSMSKISVLAAYSGYSLGFECPDFHSLLKRGLRVTQLILRDESNIPLGPGASVISGLENLVIHGSKPPPLWLSNFVESHSGLRSITFHGSQWMQNPTVTFPSRFQGAIGAQSPAHKVDLLAFSVSRSGFPSSLDEWPVTHLDLKFVGIGISVLKIASMLASRTSSLTIRMCRFEQNAVDPNDLISLCCLFPSLRRLEFHHVYRHLVHAGQSPWPIPLVSDSDRPISECVVAHSALRWLSARLAQTTPSLDVIQFADDGFDYGKGSDSYIWTLEVSYQVGYNRSIEYYGTPRFDMERKYRPPKETARLLCMTSENTRYHPVLGKRQGKTKSKAKPSCSKSSSSIDSR
ncbi:hypothetical protein R3P38DRAFT_820708 [Favolaschia claudopus]|uniref:F-box domain-containing protein n=1 Tax=Favolaschia claudopus TaxID=2862362 RepID=A0AAW0C1Q2_9AGAR